MLNWAIEKLSPSWASKREYAKFQLEQVKHARSMYDAAQVKRGLEQHIFSPSAGDDTDAGTRRNLRSKAQDLVRNNPTAQSIVNAIVGRIAPDRLQPEPMAVDPELRQQCRSVWSTWSNECHTLGFAGRGGLTISQLYQQIVREVATAGECLIYLRRYSFEEMERLNLTLPLTIEIIESERLDDMRNTYGKTDSRIFEGVQLDPLGRREGYYIRNGNPYHLLSGGLFDSKLIPAKDILHIYLPQRPSQIRGYSWLAPVLNTLLQIGDFEFNEITSSTIAACFACVLEVNSGLNLPTGGPNASPTDAREYTKLFTTPGMVPKLKPGEKLSAFEPGRPAAPTDRFTDHLLKKSSTPFPLKGSQLTGDYVGSSFSSEASNENDNLYLAQALHNWFITSVCQPIFEEVMLAALMAGELGAVDPWESGLTLAMYPQPETRSINPTNDVSASMMKATSGLGSIKKEAAKWGGDWKTNVDDLGEYIQYAESKGIPKEVLLKLLDVPVAPQEGDSGQAAGENTSAA